MIGRLLCGFHYFGPHTITDAGPLRYCCRPDCWVHTS